MAKKQRLEVISLGQGDRVSKPGAKIWLQIADHNVFKHFTMLWSRNHSETILGNFVNIKYSFYAVSLVQKTTKLKYNAFITLLSIGILQLQRI